MFPCCSKEYSLYFEEIEKKLQRLLEVADAAKAKGFDPNTTVQEEIRISRDLADRVEYMVGPPGVGKRIRDLKHLQRVNLAFKIAEEILYGAFGTIELEKAAEQAIKTGTAILTEGVTAAPIQGIAKVSIKKKTTSHNYLAIYFAGPVRSAGGTELAVMVVLGDYVRKLLGIDIYQATDDQISRAIEELRLYEREVGRFQYHVNDETIKYLLKRIPVEITGIKSDTIEVSNFRDVEGIETNCVRGGALRVINDGIAGRASKVWKIISELNLTGWEWLKNITTTKNNTDDESSYLQDIIGGRPVFSFPSTSKNLGSFRLRYGRARNTGLTCVGVHPATMIILNGFIAVGTQLRLEMPGKGGIASAVDTIEPPIIKLKNGSVIKVDTIKKATEFQKDVAKILTLGDLLISYSEFYENGRPLVSSSYVEEWWAAEFKDALTTRYISEKQASEGLKIEYPRIKMLMENYLKVKPTFPETVEISSTLKIPLHPEYVYFWQNISLEDFYTLRKAILEGKIEFNGKLAQKITLNFEPSIKKILERLFVPHEISDEKIIIYKESAPLIICCGLNAELSPLIKDQNILQTISSLAGIEIKDKYASFVGARMGRPEKADSRKMKPPVHVLFPEGSAGGAQRNIIDAADKIINVEMVVRRCVYCGKSVVGPVCPSCNIRTAIECVCPSCGKALSSGKCPRCKLDGVYYKKQIIDLKDCLNRASRKIGISIPNLVKGVKGLTSEKKYPEPLEKGLLRARYNLTIFKDGTIRYDLTNAPITHFTPSEIMVPIQKLKDLGYEKDRYGNPLVDEEQMCELKSQDIIIPEKCADFLIQVANFIDEMLERLYDMPKFYNAVEREDLVGHLVIGLSPHTSNGVLGRILGFSKLNVCYSHPLWISAKRRDCDGDEDAIIFALDVFLNFSKEFLPAQIGGIMDSPLLLTPIINPTEVDDQVWSLDLCHTCSREFYHQTIQEASPKSVSNLMDLIMFRLEKPEQYEKYGFIHDISNINMGVKENTYKTLTTMKEKLQSQMFLMDTIEGVDTKDVAKRVLNVHFIRDIAGNLKGFATQNFRCKKCNQKYRRIPLKGRCLKCSGELSLTVYRGTVEKYLDAVRWLADRYDIEEYYKQRIELLKNEIEMLFAERKINDEKKISLTQFM